MLTSAAPKRCSRSTSPDEIVVCGESLNRTQRLPYPEERGEPGARPSLVFGEVPSFSDRAPCPPRGCPGNGSLIGGISKIIERIRD